ncbi:hypothetical protein J6590_006041 [Homalodisca vitripennis]|nr:hypothetical protein J6590_006041 [Homalodisca vitripennis]
MEKEEYAVLEVLTENKYEPLVDEAYDHFPGGREKPLFLLAIQRSGEEVDVTKKSTQSAKTRTTTLYMRIRHLWLTK